jgi:signal transduction histidine kinase
MSELESAPAEIAETQGTDNAAIGLIRRTPDLATRVAAEQVRLLFDLGEANRYTIYGAIIVVGIAFYQTAPVWMTGVVLAIQIIAQFSFDRVRAGFRADPEAAERAMIWARRYAAVTALSGATWGVGALLWLPTASFAHGFFYALVIAALSMATAMTRATYPPAVFVYTAAACGPALIMLLVSNQPLGTVTVGLAVMFFASIANLSRGVNRSYREAFRLRFENSDLVERMARAHAATEQKRSEAEAAEQRAHAANRSKSEFLDILGHEVRMPLETLASMANHLCDEPLTDRQQNLAQAIGASSMMLRRLFDDMIDFSQMEARTLELKPRSFEPTGVAKGIVRLMRARAAERGLSLELDLAPDTPPRMIGDPDRLRQVLVNLVANAIKFTETGGVILRMQPVSAPELGDGLRFSVLDTGIGLTANARAILFEGFARGEPGGERGRSAGMGLGLAVADRLVRLMGGQIQVDSAPGQGSTFWFLLPVEGGAGPAPADTPPTDREWAPPVPERLVDHDYLYELERKRGAERTINHMVAVLTRIDGLRRKIDAAHAEWDAAALAENVGALREAASEIGLIAIADIAHGIGEAIDHGLGDMALHDVPRLRQKIAATGEALTRAFPGLHAP